MVVDASVLAAALVDSGKEGKWAESAVTEGYPAGPELVLAEALDCPLVTLGRKLGQSSGPRCKIIVPPRS
ncbi:MAG: hypothetical protein OXL36_17250 [Bryobacterales bacterium]|nr:hypothetical protein [Bryobacterales bacterium]MDE0296028.1 hypothetical protein [Bryobacterales bacterium]